jgi:hypothetical protein
VSETAPKPSLRKALLALVLTDLLLFMLGDALQTIAALRSGGRVAIDGDWWLMLLILFPILLAPAPILGLPAHVLQLYLMQMLVGGLATGGFALLIAVADDYFTRPGTEAGYTAVGFAAGALWGAIYAALLVHSSGSSLPQADR